MRLQKAIEPIAFIEERARNDDSIPNSTGPTSTKALDGSGWGLASGGQGDDERLLQAPRFMSRNNRPRAEPMDARA